MRLTLKMHRNSFCTAATGIDVEVARLPHGRLALRYQITGTTSDLRIPPAAAKERRDELWRHTCFEVFIRGPESVTYYEVNFSPSTQWAAYRFNGYRGEMAVASEIAPPHIDVASNAAELELGATLELEGLPDLPSHAPWHFGVSAVVEETSGRISYWALEHPLGQADFHHPDCFALILPATMSP